MMNQAKKEKKLNAWDIQRMVLRCSKDRLSCTDRMVLIALLDHYPCIRPSVRRIAALSGLAERTVRDAIGRMKEKGAISVETVFLQPNIYHIDVDFFSHLTVVPTPPPAGDAPPPLQEMHHPPAGDASKGINIRKEEEKNIGDSQSNTTSSAAKREGGKEREQTDLERMVIETEEKEFAEIKKTLIRDEIKEKARRKEIIGDDIECDEIKEKAIAFGDAFFDIYPKSDAEIGTRKLIEQMWRDGKINKDNWKSILDAVKNQKCGGILARFDKFVPLAKNWLRDGRWLDEIDKKPAKKSTKPKKKKHMVGEYNAERANKRPRVGWGDEKPKKKKHMVGEYDPESANDGPGFGWGDEKPKKKKHMVGEYDPERAKKWPGFGWGDYDPSKPKKKHMVGEYDPDLDGSTKIGW
jgi:hypothetical protein